MVVLTTTGRNHVRKGTLISLTGIDGAGKSTTTAVMAGLLEEEFAQVVHLDGKNPEFPQPYVREQAARLRNAIWDPSGQQELLGFRHYHFLTAAWYEMLDRCLVRPLLDEGQVVVTDSWYQKAAARAGLRAPHVTSTECRAAYLRLTRPDITVMLDVPPEEALARKGELTRVERGGSDGHTRGNGFVEFQHRVRESLLRDAADEGWVIYEPGARDAKVVAREVTDEVLRVLRMT